MRLVLASAIALQAFTFAPMAIAAGGGDSNPPKPTNTTKKCLFGRVYDEAAGPLRQTEPRSNFTEDQLYDAVRELAYDGQFENAQGILRIMDQEDDRVQTYWGFTYRKMGELETG